MSQHIPCGPQGKSQKTLENRRHFSLSTTRNVPKLLFVALLAVACNHPASAPEGGMAEAYLPSSGSVGFDLRPLPSLTGSTRWKAIYAAKGKMATFIVELDPGKRSGGSSPSDFPITFGDGKFVAEPGSNASVLLIALKAALEAKSLPKDVPRTTSVPFTYVIIGENESQASGGGFNATPQGNWTAIKLFMGNGEQESEVFFNVNSAIGKGEFSIKDSDYGDLLLAQFAKVL
jgi:hypothetical protein